MPSENSKYKPIDINLIKQILSSGSITERQKSQIDSFLANQPLPIILKTITESIANIRALGEGNPDVVKKFQDYFQKATSATFMWRFTRNAVIDDYFNKSTKLSVNNFLDELAKKNDIASEILDFKKNLQNKVISRSKESANLSTQVENYEYLNGNKYTGGMLNKQAHGQGKMTLENGTTLDGTFQNNTFIGGTLTLKSGNVVQGEFKDNKLYTGFMKNPKVKIINYRYEGQDITSENYNSLIKINNKLGIFYSPSEPNLYSTNTKSIDRNKLLSNITRTL